MRRDCILSKLSAQQQADLFDSLNSQSYEAVQKNLAQPPPDGLGLRVHINTLFRFFQEEQDKLRARHLAHASAAAANVTEPEFTSSFLQCSKAALAHSTYILAHSPMNPASYRVLARSLHQHDEASIKREYLDIARQQLALARERLQFDRAQFEYNAARAALALLPELIQIDRATGIDDETKVWRARARLFGSASPIPHDSPPISDLPNQSCQPTTQNA